MGVFNKCLWKWKIIEGLMFFELLYLGKDSTVGKGSAGGDPPTISNNLLTNALF